MAIASLAGDNLDSAVDSSRARSPSKILIARARSLARRERTGYSTCGHGDPISRCSKRIEADGSGGSLVARALHARHRMSSNDSLTTICGDDLATVTGGTGFLGNLYNGVVFNVASSIGGKQLAQKMYGSRMTARDQARSQAAMKQFLVAGNKLPKGVPNLFG
jgi:hypothetical protein